MLLVKRWSYSCINILSYRKDLDYFGNNKFSTLYRKSQQIEEIMSQLGHRCMPLWILPQTSLLLTCLIWNINWYPIYVYLWTLAAVPCPIHIINIQSMYPPRLQHQHHNWYVPLNSIRCMFVLRPQHQHHTQYTPLNSIQYMFILRPQHQHHTWHTSLTSLWCVFILSISITPDTHH